MRANGTTIRDGNVDNDEIMAHKDNKFPDPEYWGTRIQ